MSPTYTYSPHPMESYLLQGLSGNCEVGSISRLERAGAIWNMFWLSTPALDVLPGHVGHWSAHYRPIEQGAASITTDVMCDEVLYRKLLMHPLKFADWFEREDQDHSIYDAYNVLGEDDWSKRVITRAHEAAVRMAAADASVRAITGNVLQFRRKVA